MGRFRKTNLAGIALASALAVSFAASADDGVDAFDPRSTVAETFGAEVAETYAPVVAETYAPVVMSNAGAPAVMSVPVAIAETMAPVPAGPRYLTNVQLASLDEDDVNDPLEGLNRAIFGFNEVVMEGFFKPVATAYNDYVPRTMRTGVSNVIDHLASPVTLANDILQFELNRALITIARFLVNTTAGIFGIADVASEIGLEEHKEDFGQTLGTYGMGEGFYLVLPLFGPSNPRDAVGKFLVDSYFDPLGLYLSNTDRDAESYARSGVGALDEYAGIVDELDQIRTTSVDFYAAIRSLYRQKRDAEIANGRLLDLPPIPDYDLNLGTDRGPGSVAGVK